jgi:hypothetical protein
MSQYNVMRVFKVTENGGTEALQRVMLKSSEWRWFVTKNGVYYVQARDYGRGGSDENLVEVSKKEFVLARSTAVHGGSGDGSRPGKDNVIWVKDIV